MDKIFFLSLKTTKCDKISIRIPYLSCYDTRMFESYTYMYDGFSIYQGEEHSNCLELLFSLQTIGVWFFFIIILKGWNFNGGMKVCVTCLV